ncbi:MAG: geranylgeranylglyceryl/heptaprenylglyceryl phosphate synthase [Bacteroidetes bacterium]|nr:geranylgeranylglyceryl/heptaprenylglyceryl phosphate synthase [Bacteroidota bacterium]
MGTLSTFNKLLQIKEQRGCGYLVLIDPDKMNGTHLERFIRSAEHTDVDAYLVGGSLLVNHEFEQVLTIIKQHTTKPVIIFPGSLFQVSARADAILFLTLISGRNPDFLIGNQVIAAPILKRIGLEAIPTGYLLIEGGCVTSAEFMSNTRPIPRTKIDIALAHALAGELLGLKLLYLEAGSGAQYSIPPEMISVIHAHCSLPLIVGGGIRTPDEAREKVRAGASFIVTGTIIEENSTTSLLQQFADAIHMR